MSTSTDRLHQLYPASFNCLPEWLRKAFEESETNPYLEIRYREAIESLVQQGELSEFILDLITVEQQVFRMFSRRGYVAGGST